MPFRFPIRLIRYRLLTSLSRERAEKTEVLNISLASVISPRLISCGLNEVTGQSLYLVFKEVFRAGEYLASPETKTPGYLIRENRTKSRRFFSFTRFLFDLVP